MHRVLPVALVFVLLACGGTQGSETPPAPTAGAAAENPCAGTEEGAPANPCAEARGAAQAPDPNTGIDWSSWSSWTQVTSEPFVSQGHQKVLVELYVPDEHVDAYAALAGPLPQGFAVVKAQYAGADAASGVERLTVMAKMAAGYDPDNGDWYYGVLSADGTQAMTQGTPEMCVDCHGNATTDYVFGAPK